MKNANWYVMSYDNYGVAKPLDNPAKQYTLLCNRKTGEMCVAFKYDTSDNTWAQGHYFTDFYEALNFMYADVVENALATA